MGATSTERRVAATWPPSPVPYSGRSPQADRPKAARSRAARGHAEMVVDSAWPAADPALLVEDQVTLAVQVNGKLRDTLMAPRGLDRSAAEALALASEKVQRQLDGAAPRKVIVVPDRLVNIVA